KDQTALRAVIDSCGQEIAAIRAELRHSMTGRWLAGSGWNHHRCDLADFLRVCAPKICISSLAAVSKLKRHISDQEPHRLRVLDIPHCKLRTLSRQLPSLFTGRNRIRLLVITKADAAKRRVHQPAVSRSTVLNGLCARAISKMDSSGTRTRCKAGFNLRSNFSCLFLMRAFSSPLSFVNITS